MAAQAGHLEVVRWLVLSGANKDQGTTDDGETPLSIAAQEEHLEVVRFLKASDGLKEPGTPALTVQKVFVGDESSCLSRGQEVTKTCLNQHPRWRLLICLRAKASLVILLRTAQSRCVLRRDSGRMHFQPLLPL